MKKGILRNFIIEVICMSIIISVLTIGYFIFNRIFNKKIVFTLFRRVNIFLFILEILVFFNFKTYIDAAVIQVFLETNLNEGKEFLSLYLSMKNIMIILLSSILVFIIFLISKIINKYSIKFPNKIFKILFLLCILFSSFYFYKYRNSKKVFFYKIGFIRVGMETLSAMKNIEEYKKLNEKINVSNIELLENNSTIKNIVLVLGESTARNHMSLYNYPLETNPLLKKREKEGNLFKFTDVISPHAHTIPVVEKLFTFTSLENNKEWIQKGTIMNILKKAGYKTFWFSNQESSGIYGNLPATFAKQSDIVLFNSLRDSKKETLAFDEEIVNKAIKKLQNNKGEKKFIVIHLMGTHSQYGNRYPKEYNIFDEKYYTENLDKKKRKRISEYDNTVLYNDFVIDKIIDYFESEEAIVLYLSDHGEEVYDFRDFVGHAESNGSRYMVEIPFLIYTSDKFKERYPNKVEMIEKAVNNPYMTDDLIHTILDIAEVKVEEYDEKRSILNPNFNKIRKRIFARKDYDKYWKLKN